MTRYAYAIINRWDRHFCIEVDENDIVLKVHNAFSPAQNELLDSKMIGKPFEDVKGWPLRVHGVIRIGEKVLLFGAEVLDKQTRLSLAKPKWETFGDVPVNEDGELEESFEHFKAGTDREDVWHWFEEEYDLSVGEDLMYTK